MNKFTFQPGRLMHPGVTFFAFCLFAYHAQAAPEFPKLRGRVVDNADMLDPAAEQRIARLLNDHEAATTNQVVVVTLPDLGGYDIETYGYQLGRHWGIGLKGKNNGVLLIVAKQERKVRIEVGYGLEGTLTDAVSANIINAIIVPGFKRADFSGGIENGVAAIIQALGGQYEIREQRRSRSDSGLGFIIFLVIFLIIMGNIFTGGGRSRHGARSRWYYGGGGFGGRGGFGGGGFSGGGGSFGGGGASGGW